MQRAWLWRHPYRYGQLFALLLALPSAGFAAEPMTVTVDGIAATGQISKRHAACIPTIDGKSTPGENIRPAIRWSAGPEATRSYAVIVTDADVPADLSIANQEDLLIAEDMPRQVFHHWVLFNISPTVNEIPGVPYPPGFGRMGANDVARDKVSYSGPCPPWNDAQVHRYAFTVYALDVPRLPGLGEGAMPNDVVELTEKHAIARGEQVGTYTLNPDLGAKAAAD